MTANPELRRYAWLELGWHRAILVPLVLGALAAVPVLSVPQPQAAIAWGAMAIFIVVTIGWGTLRAWGSVTEEVRDRTWDFQRMAASTPASLALGKVFGAPVFQWYVGAWCVLAYAWAARAAALSHAGANIVTAVALAVLLHGVGVGASAASARLALGSRSRRAGGVILLLVLSNVLPVAALFGGGSDAPVRWWGVAMSLAAFTSVTCVLFAAWALVGAWRAMARELREPIRHWAWPAFAATAAAWWAGLAAAGTMRPSVSGSLALASGVLTVATYSGVTLDPLTRVSLARLRRAWGATGASWRPRVPGWGIDAALAIVVALLALAMQAPVAGPFVFGPALSSPPGSFALPVALMALRDAAVVGCFALWSRTTRPAALAAFYIALADLLVPAVFTSMGQPLLARLVCPLWAFATDAWFPAIGMAVHAAVALAVLWVRISAKSTDPA